MNYEYSQIMKSLMKRKPSPLVHLLIITIMAILVGGITLGYTSAKDDKSHLKENTPVFDSSSKSGNYSKFTPELMSDVFASNYDESIVLCFVTDKEYNTCIVAINADDIDQYQELIEYSYDDTITKVPAQMTLQGMPEEISDDLVEFVVDGYNSFYGGDLVDESSYHEVLGYYYLDTTQEPEADYGLMILSIFLFVILGSIYILLIRNGNKLSKHRQATLNNFGDKITWEVDQELNKPTAVCFNSQKVCFTDNYIVSSIHGFDIVPLADTIIVYGCIYRSNNKKNNNSIVIVTKDGKKHEIAIVKMNRDGEARYSQIMEQIKLRCPEIQYGFENEFYVWVDKKFTADIDYNEGNVAVKSNMFFGTFGAILGAMLGSVIWIIIGKLGFIAGLAGFLMMIFAIMGYRLFSGCLDKKGQIMSLLIAFAMIFVANYTLYALEYCKYYYASNYSLVHISSAFKKLPEVFTMTDSWGDFILDLVIGYFLSICSGVGIIKSTFTRRQ